MTPLHLRDLQALRGVACLLVVLYHVAVLEAGSVWDARLVWPFERFGFGGVDVFFVLSGFIIMAAHHHKLGTAAEFRPYLFKRLWRIFPAYWACFAAVAVLFGGGLDPASTPGYAGRVVFDALLLPHGRVNVAIPQAWTLSYELMFYALFGAFFLQPRANLPRLLGGWLAAAVVCSFAVRPQWHFLLWPLSPYTIEFLLGTLAALSVQKLPPRAGPVALAVGGCWAAAGVGLSLFGVAPSSESPVERLCCFGGPAALIVLGVAVRERAGTTTFPRVFRGVGNVSYSIYLTHVAVLWAFQIAGVYAVPWGRPVQVLWIAVQVAAACGVGYGVYRLVEKPLLDWGRRPKVPRSEPAPAGVLQRVA